MSEIHRDKILQLVKDVEHKHSIHPAVRTSEEAASVRGVSLSSGAKALVLTGRKTGKNILCVIPAQKKVDFKSLKNYFADEFTFAQSPETLVGCVPGSVPPFGSVLGLQTLADLELEEVLNFNIGLLTESVSISKKDYLNLEKPIVGSWSK
jgi:Ala-tRNA(Pro) deacylase